MARIRTIKPEFPQSESMGRVSRESRLCFILLWTIADDAGRLRGSSRMLASLLYPYDDDAKKLTDKWLAELEKERCIVRYESGGDKYVQICGWLTHQKIDKPSQSKIPSPPEDSRSLARIPAPQDPTREDSTADQGMDQGREGKVPGAAALAFAEFWEAWPKSERKQDKAKCAEKFKAQDLAAVLPAILADIATKKLTDKWQKGFIEAPEVYINNRRWEDGTTPGTADLTVANTAAATTAAYLASQESRASPLTDEQRALLKRARGVATGAALKVAA